MNGITVNAMTSTNAESISTSPLEQQTAIARRSRVWSLSILALAISLLGATWWWLNQENNPTPASTYTWKPPRNLNPDRAFGYLENICAFGPRPSGSPNLNKLQDYLIDFFKGTGATVDVQEFNARHPMDGSMVKMKNIIVRIQPQLQRRILFCTHYDTRPFPDEDPTNPRGTFIGANDGGSGVALFQEIAPLLLKMKLNVGVDLIMFDGEELIYEDAANEGEYFLGSKEFATRYRAEPPGFTYEAGILLDMVGDKELHLYYERNSFDMARSLARDVWGVAQRLKIREFIARTRHLIRDDHLPLNEIARIPTIDLIDFDYPRPSTRGPNYWHTEKDIPANCSGESICKVAAVLLEWLETLK